MTIRRPYIPLSARVQVAERQVRESGSLLWPLYSSGILHGKKLDKPWPLARRLRVLLGDLFPDGDHQLDHDPALVLRRFNKRIGKYSPPANDPDYLVYRRKGDHLQKTTGRKPGAERTITTKGSDVGLKTKFARLEKKKGRKRTKPRRHAARKIQSRPFQKGRKLR